MKTMVFKSPYPQSTTIRGLRWLTEPALYPKSFGDVWSSTWADDGHLYCVSDDTTGIDEACKSNLAFHRIEGNPPSHRAVTVNPMSDYGTWGGRDGQDNWKANGMISVDGTLYLSVSQHSCANDYPDNIKRTYDHSIVNSEV